MRKIVSIAQRFFRKNESYFFMKDNPAYRKYQIGEFTYGKPAVADYGDTRLVIGKYCSFAEKVQIILGGNHRVDWNTTYPFNAIFEQFDFISGHPQTKGNLIIGNDVWVGTGATILSGLQIGDGAVVGAGSLVTKSVPPYSIVTGNPARVVKQRFDPDRIEALLRMQWWDLESEQIEKLVPFLQSDDFERLEKEYDKFTSHD